MFRLNISRRGICEGKRIPKFYGIAYMDYPRAIWICYPVPFNLIVHWAREFWFWLITWHPNQREVIEMKLAQSKLENAKLQHQLDAAVDLITRTQKCLD